MASRNTKVQRSRKISSMREYEIYYGKEPTWLKEYKNKSEWFNDMRSAYQWYNIAPIKSADKKKWLLEFLDQNEYQEFDEDFVCKMRKVPDSFLATVGTTARMLANGAKFPEDEYDSFLKIMANVENIRGDKPESEIKKPKNIQTSIQLQASDHISEVENQIADFVDGGYESDFSMYDYLVNNDIKGLIANKVRMYFLDEYNSFCDENDEYMKEAYSHMNPKERKRYLNFLGEMLEDLNTHIKKCSASKKLRNIKAKPPEKLVAKLFYLEEYTPLNLKSINPKKLIGASELWTYNIKSKAVTVYRAESPRGMTVLGSTLKGFDEKNCMRKRLRKPELFFSVATTKSRARKELLKLKTKEQNISGRISKDVILLFSAY